jgi:hypothetical protein
MAVSLSSVPGKSASPILIGLLTEIGAIYIIVRGMDNIAKETRIKAAWEAFFIKEIANRLWDRRVETSGRPREHTRWRGSKAAVDAPTPISGACPKAFSLADNKTARPPNRRLRSKTSAQKR